MNLTQRYFLRFATVCVLLATSIISMSCQDSIERKHNIIFIMADDHTTQAIGVYGSRLAELNPTPNIDALANGGMRFDRVYCNNAICTPSRASILSGQYPQTNGVLDIPGSLSAERQFLPLEMRKQGYQTAMIGKWHLKKEPAVFDYYCVLPGQGKYHNPEFRIRGNQPWPENIIQKDGQHSSDAITDISLDWLKNKRDKSKPFMLMHHFKAPHDMFENAKRYDSYLEDVDIPEPGNLHNQPEKGFGSVASRNFGAGVTKAHQSWELSKQLSIDQDLAEPDYGRQTYQEYLKRYLRCVKGVDDNVKRLVDYLKETGELDNTIIIYTGDQGLFLGEHDLIDKRWMYEEALRMPFIVYAPKLVRAGSNNGWIINNTDFAPTILELAGVEKTPEYMQGHSFVAALKGHPKPVEWRTYTYYRYWMHMAHSLRVPAHFGIRSDRYKLIFFYGSDYREKIKQTPVAWEFYDLEKDPMEMNNLYNNPEYIEIIESMKVELKNTRVELNETDQKFPHIEAILKDNYD